MCTGTGTRLQRNVLSLSLESGANSVNTWGEPSICWPKCWKKERRWMKAEHVRMQQKSWSQTSYSADKCVMYVTWQLGHGVHQQKDAQGFCSWIGRAQGSTNSSQFSWKCHKELKSVGAFWFQFWDNIPVLGGHMCPQSLGTHSTSYRLMWGCTDSTTGRALDFFEFLIAFFKQ